MYASSPLSPPGVGFGASNPIQLSPIYAGGMRSTSGAYGSGHPGSPLVRGGAGYPQSPRLASPMQSGGMAQASGAGAVVPPAVMQKMVNQLGMAAQYGKDGKVLVKHTPGSENPSKFIVPQLPEGKEEKRKARATYTTPTCVAQVQGPYNHVLSSGDFEVVFRYDFCYQTRTWAQTCMVVSIQKKPFAEGSLRNAYKAVDLSKPSGLGEFVAKEYKQKEKAECYFTDVDMQGICEFYAEKYNEKGPPKPVTFLHAFLIERVQRSGRPLLACEDFMKGKFDKFNNNYGFKSQGDEATPQAFSHFTFEESRQSIMIVDIQGIAEGDAYSYTDPQIHTLDGKGFGMGNLGREGMMKFFGTHLCNSICVGLGLARKQQGGFQSTAMNKEKVEEARKRRQALLENKDKENKEQPQGQQYKEQFLTPAAAGPHGSPVSGQQAPKSGKSEPMISEYEAKSGGVKQSL